ncbi:MAG TPA: helix-hairpin-helix domain-containing protein, partial [Chitinophagaceae bacterium]|nr:helix-hairpin-helix domain-containing protein [Chitinophagaceae bacterium]
MPGKFVKDYLSFSKKERVAVLILVFLIFVIFSLPYLLPKKQESFDHAGFAKFKSEASRLGVDRETRVHSKEEKLSRSTLVPGKSGRYVSSSQGEGASIAELFYFDPNSLAAEGWKKLGLPDRNIRTIQNYLLKGGKFRSAEDLDKIYGLRQPDVARLKPYVRIRPLTPKYMPGKPGQARRYEHQGSLTVIKTARPLVDLNLGDTTSLISLPGIGSKLAARIIRFREKLGGFYTVDQLAEVYGVPDSTFQQIKDRLTVSSNEIKKINLNTAELQELQHHPYLRGTTARLIIEYRGQHGNF